MLALGGEERLSNGHPRSPNLIAYVLGDKNLVTGKTLDRNGGTIEFASDVYGITTEGNATDQHGLILDVEFTNSLVNGGCSVIQILRLNSIASSKSAITFGCFDGSRRWYLGVGPSPDDVIGGWAGSSAGFGGTASLGMHAIAMCSGTGEAKVYHDGVLEHTITSTFSGSFSSGKEFPYIHALNDSTTNVGTIDHICTLVFDVNLSAQEVAQISSDGWQDFIEPDLSYGQLLTLLADTATSITVPVGSLTLTGQAPTLELAVDVPVGSISITGQTPELMIDVGVPAGSLTLTGHIPGVDVEGDETVDVPVGSLSLAGQTPTLFVGKEVEVPTGTITMTGYPVTIKVIEGEVVLSADATFITLTGKIGL